MIETSLLLGKGYRMNPMKEIVSGTPTKFLGANITGTEGGAYTKILSIDLNDSRHFKLCEVDGDGTVVKIHGSLHQMDVSDLGKSGVQIFQEALDDPIIKPGQHEEVNIGPYPLIIEGTTDQGILFNGNPAIKFNDMKSIKAALPPRKH